MTTKVLLIGCGEIATAAHLPALADLERAGAVEATVCDHDASKAKAAAEKFGMRVAPDWQRGAADADAVVVCLPPGPNAEISIAAVEMGRHVLCEKPPGRDLAQARQMAAAAAAHPDLVTMIAFNRRFTPLYRLALDRSFRQGRPNSFYGRFSRAAMDAVPSNTASDWITSDSIHGLDLAIATMGFPTAVSVGRGVVGAGLDNAWSLHLHCPQGSALLLFNYAAARRVERFEWVGPGYDVVLELPGQGEWAQVGQPSETLSSEEVAGSSAYPIAYGFAAEHAAFIAAIAGEGAPPACDFAYGANLMALIQTILDSPSGAQTAVELSAAATEPTSAPVPVVERPTSTTSGSPVVLIQQAPASHPRFFPPDKVAALRRNAEVHTWTETEADDAVLARATVLITGRGGRSLPDDLVARAKNLELLVVLGASVRNYHPAELLERGVLVCNTADAVAQSVAEHCLLLTLAGLRLLPQNDRAMHSGGWPRPAGARRSSNGASRTLRVQAQRLPLSVKTSLRTMEARGRSAAAKLRRGSPLDTMPPLPAADLSNQVVGFLGWGRIASHFARLLAPFDVDLLVATEAAPPDELAAVGARVASVGEILGAAKVISLHKGLTEQTRGMLGADELAQLRPGTVLVNTARGELIDEAALVERLARGDVVAALDVYEEEPLPRSHPLRNLPCAILTPHHASSTTQEERRMGTQAIDIVLAHIAGKPIDSIDSARLARMT